MPARRYVRSLLAALIGLCLFLPVFTPSAQCETKEEKKAREKEEQRAKKERERLEKEAKRDKKEEARREDQAKKYNTLMDFALDYYASDPDFLEVVDKEYAKFQRMQATYAFSINMTRATDLKDILEQVQETEGTGLYVRRTLYDNPRLQDFVNRIGQRLVPADSEKLYAFRVLQNPIPEAFTLATGTIYVTTGLLSMLDNEAQLAYVLSHELAHVHKDHHRMNYVMMPLAEAEYNRRQERKRALFGALIAGAAAGVGGAVKGKEGAAIGALSGFTAGYIVSAFTLARRSDVAWEYVQENEADDFALKNTLDRNYDIQEIPKMYLALARASSLDQRIGLGFLGNKQRIKDRNNHVQKEIQSTYLAEYQTRLKAGQLIGTSPEFQLMMAELKRDNGILAYYFDMFGLAQQNLRQAVALRSDDARARLYYGLVTKLVARTNDEQELARQQLLAAIKLDQDRHDYPEADLQRAVLLMDRPDSASQNEAMEALKNYIVAYRDRHVQDKKYGDTLPPNMEVMYDYLRLLGDPKWKAPYPEFYRVVAGDVVLTKAGAAGSEIPATAGGGQPGSVPITPVQSKGPGH
jgi:predicted Zn-dependent protease